MDKFTEIKVDPASGTFAGTRTESDGWSCKFTASFDLFLIHKAWGPVDFEDLADGYGAGEGTHGDWSGIRDSTRGAKDAMFQRALNHFFGD